MAHHVAAGCTLPAVGTDIAHMVAAGAGALLAVRGLAPA
jgi:hypothetical protein